MHNSKLKKIGGSNETRILNGRPDPVGANGVTDPLSFCGSYFVFCGTKEVCLWRASWHAGRSVHYINNGSDNSR